MTMLAFCTVCYWEKEATTSNIQTMHACIANLLSKPISGLSVSLSLMTWITRSMTLMVSLLLFCSSQAKVTIFFYQQTLVLAAICLWLLSMNVECRSYQLLMLRCQMVIFQCCALILYFWYKNNRNAALWICDDPEVRCTCTVRTSIHPSHQQHAAIKYIAWSL